MNYFLRFRFEELLSKLYELPLFSDDYARALFSLKLLERGKDTKK